MLLTGQINRPAEVFRQARPLGEGGFAVTYLATDRSTGRICVIKELSWAKIDDWKFIELFEREARVLANLNHPQNSRIH